ncbi:hypothetical protein K1719_044249 [Acacia pycnantha]|nr:hypothetical protein K1719_044249 [Acacia pycnantha]
MFSWAFDKIKCLPVKLGINRNDRTPAETGYYVGGESSSSSKTLDSSPPWKYDVFLSFAGKDTRLNFTSHLYEAFKRSGIKCFMDNVDLPKGKDINDLFQAIEESLCAVLVISKKKFKDNTTKVQSWRTALSKVGNLSGWVTRDKDEAELIKDILEKGYGVWAVWVKQLLLELFTKISCKFEGWRKEEVTQILEACDLNPKFGIKIAKFGEIKEVLENNKGSREIEAIVMEDWPEDEDVIEVHPEALS